MSGMMTLAATVVLLVMVSGAPLAAAESAAGNGRPLVRDFMGLCGHYHFDGALFAPVARHVRNYHGINWDLDLKQPFKMPPYPFAINGVNWEGLYGKWQEAGFEIDASLMFAGYTAEDWGNPAETAYWYGRAFAHFMGPSGKGLVHTAELGNEPTHYSDEDYTRVAHALALGLKAGDPKLRVATAAAGLDSGNEYAKNIACFDGWMDLVDVINVHSYAIMGEWPNRRRTYPEDPACDFTSRVGDVLAWRDANAPGKEVWITEFGWDAHRAEGAPLEEGTPIHERPSAISRVQQAQFLVRAYLIFARMGLDRAYMFWYQDDAPEKGLHNADGLVSGGVKQPAFYAMASLKANLGDYRFERVVHEDLDGVYAYLFRSDEGGACVAAWSPTMGGAQRECAFSAADLGLEGAKVGRAVELALGEAGETAVEAASDGGNVRVTVGGTPVLVFLTR